MELLLGRDLYVAGTLDAQAFVNAYGVLGDVNCDAQVDFRDINPFVLRLSNPAQYVLQYPECPDANSDINSDGTVDFGDINPLVALLSGSD